jgi:hypothetical protein
MNVMEEGMEAKNKGCNKKSREKMDSNREKMDDVQEHTKVEVVSLASLIDVNQEE